MEPTPNQVPPQVQPIPQTSIPPQQPISSFTPPQNMPQANMMSEHHEHKSIGPIVGSLIIVILIVAAGIYIWGQKLNNEDRNGVLENGTTTDQSQTQQTQVQTSGTQQTSPTTSQSSVDASIEQELDADFGELDDMNF